MKKFYRFLILASIILFFTNTQAEQMSPLTLRECFELALKQSETIAIQKETLKEISGIKCNASAAKIIATIMPSSLSRVWGRLI